VVVVETIEAVGEETPVVVVEAEEASMAAATEVEEASEAAVATEVEEPSMVAATEAEEAFEAAAATEAEEVSMVATTEVEGVFEAVAAAATEEVVAFVAVTEVASAVDVEGSRAPKSSGKSILGLNSYFISNSTLQRRHQRSSARY
jgi:hypothetical protein